MLDAEKLLQIAPNAQFSFGYRDNEDRTVTLVSSRIIIDLTPDPTNRCVASGL